MTIDAIMPGVRVLCAVSGGVDSMYLLHRMTALGAQRGFAVGCAHFNHGLRGAESDRDEAFVRAQCKKLGVPFYAGRGDVASVRGMGTEAAARKLRYAFLAQCAQAHSYDWIATAHTADDNAETLLLNLARGCGLRGLTGIPPRRGNLLRPMLDTLDESDLASRKVLNEIFLRNVNSQHKLARELEHSRSELEHGKMEILLRTGSVSQETLQQLTDAVQLKAYNFLLLIPSLQENAECSLKEELRTVVVSEQIRQIYGQRFYVQATADDLILVILTQETDEAEELREMCFRTEQLYDALHLTTPLILSDPFEKMEQLSDIYWKARNVAAYADPTQKICYLGNSSAQRGTMVNATNAARLREYLLSGCTEEAVSLLSELFSVDNLDPENFKQDFYTAGGILLNTAERVCCPDIAYLCSYDSKLTARQMLSRLQDCCVEICNHVQFLKHSHNDALQKNILDWLAQNFQNPEINAAMTAEQFKISKKYLSQFLKEQTGKSYTEYVEELRLDHAMQLLRTTDLNITDIAEQCGFSTANTFYKAFRRKYQLSPSAVRKGDN